MKNVPQLTVQSLSQTVCFGVEGYLCYQLNYRNLKRHSECRIYFTLLFLKNLIQIKSRLNAKDGSKSVTGGRFPLSIHSSKLIRVKSSEMIGRVPKA